MSPFLAPVLRLAAAAGKASQVASGVAGGFLGSRGCDTAPLRILTDRLLNYCRFTDTVAHHKGVKEGAAFVGNATCQPVLLGSESSHGVSVRHLFSCCQFSVDSLYHLVYNVTVQTHYTRRVKRRKG